jgi:hypothetical protein
VKGATGAAEILMPRRRAPTWTLETAVAAVQRFATEHGYQPVSREAGPRNGLPTWRAAARLFGSWNGLIEAAGFVPYPARSSAHAKTRAFRDRNPGWRETAVRGARSARVA